MDSPLSKLRKRLATRSGDTSVATTGELDADFQGPAPNVLAWLDRAAHLDAPRRLTGSGLRTGGLDGAATGVVFALYATILLSFVLFVGLVFESLPEVYVGLGIAIVLINIWGFDHWQKRRQRRTNTSPHVIANLYTLLAALVPYAARSLPVRLGCRDERWWMEVPLESCGDCVLDVRSDMINATRRVAGESTTISGPSAKHVAERLAELVARTADAMEPDGWHWASPVVAGDPVAELVLADAPPEHDDGTSVVRVTCWPSNAIFAIPDDDSARNMGPIHDIAYWGTVALFAAAIVGAAVLVSTPIIGGATALVLIPPLLQRAPSRPRDGRHQDPTPVTLSLDGSTLDMAGEVIDLSEPFELDLTRDPHAAAPRVEIEIRQQRDGVWARIAVAVAVAPSEEFDDLRAYDADGALTDESFVTGVWPAIEVAAAAHDAPTDVRLVAR